MRTGLLALLLLAPAVQAQDLDHDYFDAGHFRGEVADTLDFDGWRLRGSTAFGDWLLTGGYERIDTEPVEVAGLFRLETGSRMFRFGGGYAFGLHERLDFVTEAGVVRSETYADLTDPSTGNDISIIPDETDTGYYVSLALRGSLARLEAEVGHRFTNVHSDRQNDWRVDLRYLLTPRFALGLGHRDLEGETATELAVRWFY